MPRKAFKNKRKPRRYYKKKVIGRPPRRALSAPRPYYFKRTLTTTATLSAQDIFWTSQGSNLGKAFAFNLQGLMGETDFTNLFKYYRLKGARVRMYFSNTGSVTSSNTNAAISPDAPNSQLLVTIDRNMNGEISGVADESKYLQSQTAKRIIALGGDRKPVDIYMPLKQGRLIYLNENTTNNTLISPKWLSTKDKETPHWGYNVMIQRVDGEAFTIGMGNRQSVKILTTIYLQCKKVE